MSVVAKLGSFVNRAVEVKGQALKALQLFKRFGEITGNEGRPFAPTNYDFDSLDNRDPEMMERVIELVAKPMEQYFRAEVRGIERVPEGPNLFVGNHNGGTWSPEIFLFGGAMYRIHGLEHMPYGLAHESIAHMPPIARVLIPIGAVRANHENAARIFARRRNVLVFPGGDEEAFRPSHLRDQIVFGGRRGYVRLALRHGVPIVPVVAFGAHDVFFVIHDGRWLARRLGIDRTLRMKVFPITFSLPWGVMAGGFIPFVPLPARVVIDVLEPIEFARCGEAAANDDAYVARCAREVETRMQASLTSLALELRHGQTDLASFMRAPANNQHAVSQSVDAA